MFFDLAVDPMVTCKTPGGGRDILLAPAPTTCTTASRWRTSRDSTSGTRSIRAWSSATAASSRRCIASAGFTTPRLRAGRRPPRTTRCRTRHRRSRRRLRALIRWYTTGDDADREAFDIAWVQNRDSVVDTMNGFIEVYMDARGMKGAWQGVVYYVNHDKTEKIHRLADHAQWFEDHLPIDRGVPQAAGAGHLRARDRGRVRIRRLRPGDADRRQPAERSAYSRAVRQQVACRCRT